MNSPDLQSISKDDLIELAKIGLILKKQHVGRHKGEFHRYIASIAKNMKKPTFAGLLYELELAAVMRDEQGEKASPRKGRSSQGGNYLS